MGLFEKFLVLLGARSVIKTIEKSQIEQQRRMQLAEMERLRLEEERDALIEMQEDYEDRIDELEDEIDELQDIIDDARRKPREHDWQGDCWYHPGYCVHSGSGMVGRADHVGYHCCAPVE